MGCGFSSIQVKPSEAVPKYFSLRRKAFNRAFPRFRFAVNVVCRRGVEELGTTDDHVLCCVGSLIISLLRSTIECAEAMYSVSHAEPFQRDEVIYNYVKTIGSVLHVIQGEDVLEDRFSLVCHLASLLELSEDSLRHWLRTLTSHVREWAKSARTEDIAHAEQALHSVSHKSHATAESMGFMYYSLSTQDQKSLSLLEHISCSHKAFKPKLPKKQLHMIQPFLYNPPHSYNVKDVGLHDSLDSPSSSPSASLEKASKAPTKQAESNNDSKSNNHHDVVFLLQQHQSKGTPTSTAEPQPEEDSPPYDKEHGNQNQEAPAAPPGAPPPIRAPERPGTSTSTMLEETVGEGDAVTEEEKDAAAEEEAPPLLPTPNLEAEPLAMSTASPWLFEEDTIQEVNEEEEEEGDNDGPEEDVSDDTPPPRSAEYSTATHGPAAHAHAEYKAENGEGPAPRLQPLRLLSVSSRRSRSGSWRFTSFAPPPHHRAASSPFLSLEDDTPWPSFASPYPGTSPSVPPAPTRAPPHQGEVHASHGNGVT